MEGVKYLLIIFLLFNLFFAYERQSALGYARKLSLSALLAQTLLSECSSRDKRGLLLTSDQITLHKTASWLRYSNRIVPKGTVASGFCVNLCQGNTGSGRASTSCS